MANVEQLTRMLDVYGYPSQAYWRAFELDALSRLRIERPILELGCADGAFTKEALGTVEVGIDVNPRSIERATKSGVFKDVRLQDARKLDDKPEFRTVFANSVLEHIPDLKGVLAGCFRALEAGGKLITTVPLVDMNKSMLFSSPSWIRRRHAQMSHVNLWTLDEWKRVLQEVGFTVTYTERYLSPQQIQLWDTLDGFTVVGTAKINIGSISKGISRLLPAPMKHFMFSSWAKGLSSRLMNDGLENGCCALIVATKN